MTGETKGDDVCAVHMVGKERVRRGYLIDKI